jgi:hypothetical protein
MKAKIVLKSGRFLIWSIGKESIEKLELAVNVGSGLLTGERNDSDYLVNVSNIDYIKIMDK